jgi:hypothetical protein
MFFSLGKNGVLLGSGQTVPEWDEPRGYQGTPHKRKGMNEKKTKKELCICGEYTFQYARCTSRDSFNSPGAILPRGPPSPSNLLDRALDHRLICLTVPWTTHLGAPTHPPLGRLDSAPGRCRASNKGPLQGPYVRGCQLRTRSSDRHTMSET